MSLRLVVFGELGADAPLLDDSGVRSTLRAALAAHDPTNSPDRSPGRPLTVPTPSPAVAAGIVTNDGHLGERVLVIDPAPWQTELDTAAVAIVEQMGSLICVLREAAATAVPDPNWTTDRALVLGGLLLDVYVGERLRVAGHCHAVKPGWTLWVLPPVNFTLGFRGRHRDGVGAGVLWAQGMAMPALPTAPELAALAGGSAPAAAMLGLRVRGWLRGYRPDYLLLRRGEGLDTALVDAADALIEAGHAKLFAALPFGPGDQRRLAFSRLLMEAALARLVCTDAFAPPRETDRRRFVWLGPDWLLAAETTGAASG